MDSGLARHRVSMGGAGSDGVLGTAIFRFWAPNCSHVPSRPRQMDSGLARHRVSMGGAGSGGMLRTTIFHFPAFPVRATNCHCLKPLNLLPGKHKGLGTRSSVNGFGPCPASGLHGRGRLGRHARHRDLPFLGFDGWPGWEQEGPEMEGHSP